MKTLKINSGLKFTKHIGVVGAFYMLLLPVVVVADSCSYEEQLSFTLPASAISSLDVKAGAGMLQVSSSPDAQEITVSARVCASRKSGLEGMGIEHIVRGDTQFLWTHIPESRGIFWTSNYSYIDLELIIPQGLAMQVEDGGGALEITGAGSVVLKDGSGAARIFGISGDVRVNDGSGSLTIEDVQGSVDVTDGSGALDIMNVAGVVTINDGSGDINVRGVRQELRIVESGSGSVRVDGVRGYPAVTHAEPR